MQCTACGKTGFVNVGGKRFCSSCGELMARPKPMDSGVKVAPVVSNHAPLDLRAAAKTPAPSVGGAAKHPLRPQSLDLRRAHTTVKRPASATPKAVASVVQPAPKTAPQVTPAAIVEPAKISKAVVSKKIASKPAQAETSKPQPVTTPVRKRGLIHKIGQHPAIAKQPAGLPKHVEASVQTMGENAANALPFPSPQSPALKQALRAARQSNTTSTLVKLGAGVASVLLLSGVVWVQNSPKLAFQNAASKAGIEASLPTFVPSSYHQAGAPKVADGQLAIEYKSPSSDQPLGIIQRRSDWDSDSLRENYVAKQTNDFTAVQGQGLTIYMFNNTANWINHGVWYQLSGTARLSQNQVLKMVYGL